MIQFTISAVNNNNARSHSCKPIWRESVGKQDLIATAFYSVAVIIFGMSSSMLDCKTV